MSQVHVFEKNSGTTEPSYTFYFGGSYEINNFIVLLIFDLVINHFVLKYYFDNHAIAKKRNKA